MERVNKINYYLDIAETVSERSTCLKKKYGAIIVKNDAIITTGFNGASRGVDSCLKRGHCLRENAERGFDYNHCLSVHSEQNCIIHASREQTLGSDMYLVGLNKVDDSYVDNAAPCALCKRMIINAGINRVIVRINKEEYIIYDVDDWKKNIDVLIGGY